MTVSPTQKRRALWALCALFIFVTALWAMRSAESGTRPQFLVANREIPAGAPLSSFFFGLVRTEQLAQPLPPDAVSDQELHLLKGTLVNLPLRQGDLLRRSHLRLADPPKRISEQIPLGSRAYLLEVAAAAAVKPGDRVDVTVSVAGGVTVAAENVLVLEAFRSREITVAVTLPELETLELARGRGNFGVVLRNPRDKQTGRRSFRPKRENRIPIFHEG